MTVENINIDALTVGKTYKSFKELALALGYEKAPGGDSKKALLKELERFYELERKRNSNAIKVVKKRETPLPPVRKTGNNVKYVFLLEEILSLLGSGEYGNYLWECRLGIVPEAYRELVEDRTRRECRKLLLRLGYTKHMINQFVYRTDQKLYSIFDGFINSMLKQDKIEYSIQLKVKNVDNETEYYTDEYGNIQDFIPYYRNAHRSEERNIEEIEASVLEEMGVENPRELGIHMKEYYKEVRKRVLDEYNIKYFWAIKIVVKNTSDIPEAERKRLLKEKKAELQEIIKQTLLEQVDKIVENEPMNFQKRKEKARSRIAVGEVPNSKVYRLRPYFESQQKALIERFF
jgi:hypothetical protein